MKQVAEGRLAQTPHSQESRALNPREQLPLCLVLREQAQWVGEAAARLVQVPRSRGSKLVVWGLAHVGQHESKVTHVPFRARGRAEKWDF